MLSNYQAVGIYEGFYDGSKEDISDSIEIIADQFIHNTYSHHEDCASNIESDFRSLI
jgi:hypothetical protein